MTRFRSKLVLYSILFRKTVFIYGESTVDICCGCIFTRVSGEQSSGFSSSLIQINAMVIKVLSKDLSF